MTESLDLAQRDNDDDIVGGGGNDRNLSKSKKSKNTMSEIQTHLDVTGESTFLTSDTIEIFNQLRQAFIKALIL